MADEVVIPTIGNLNREQPDYISRLEEGMDTIGKLYSNTTQDFLETRVKMDKEKEARFRKVEGIEFIDVMEALGPLVGLVDQITGIKMSDAKIAVAKTAEAEAAMQDIETEVDEKYNSEIESLEDRTRMLNRSKSDFMHAIFDATEVKSINETNYGHQGYVFFILRGNEVYKTGFTFLEGYRPFINGGKDEELNAANFLDDSYLENLSREADKYMANGYVVSNPSSLIPKNVMLFYAVKEVLDDVVKKLNDANIKGEERLNLAKLKNNFDSCMMGFAISEDL